MVLVGVSELLREKTYGPHFSIENIEELWPLTEFGPDSKKKLGKPATAVDI
jgi:hypothetical protein